MIRLLPMRPGEYSKCIEPAVRDYAQSKILAGDVEPDRALEFATREYAAYLPEGVDTPGHYLRTIQDADTRVKVGFIWLGILEKGGTRFPMLMQVWIDEPYRRQGYATQALLALEEQVGGLGFDEIVLHVYGHNHAARTLYKKLGYVETNINMRKILLPQAESGR